MGPAWHTFGTGETDCAAHRTPTELSGSPLGCLVLPGPATYPAWVGLGFPSGKGSVRTPAIASRRRVPSKPRHRAAARLTCNESLELCVVHASHVRPIARFPPGAIPCGSRARHALDSYGTGSRSATDITRRPSRSCGSPEGAGVRRRPGTATPKSVGRRVSAGYQWAHGREVPSGTCASPRRAAGALSGAAKAGVSLARGPHPISRGERFCVQSDDPVHAQSHMRCAIPTRHPRAVARRGCWAASLARRSSLHLTTVPPRSPVLRGRRTLCLASVGEPTRARSNRSPIPGVPLRSRLRRFQDRCRALLVGQDGPGGTWGVKAVLPAFPNFSDVGFSAPLPGRSGADPAEARGQGRCGSGTGTTTHAGSPGNQAANDKSHSRHGAAKYSSATSYQRHTASSSSANIGTSSPCATAAIPRRRHREGPELAGHGR